ncbi:MAG: HIRAN domain-containing protein [Salinisphaeraceae bacterium]
MAASSEGQSQVRGLTVTAAGSLDLWENRDELRAVVEGAGGRFVASMSGKVDVLVLGAAPRDGQTTAEKKAIELRAAGGSVRLVDELQMVAMLGNSEIEPGMTLESLRMEPSWAAGGAWRRWEEPSSCVAGEGNYRQAFVLALGQERPAGYYSPRDLDLVRDPLNPHDPNAVRVELGGLTLGFVARALAERLASAMDAAGVDRATVPGIVRGGYSIASADRATSFSVALWLKRVESASRIRVKPPRGLDRVPHWPPRAFDGREGCPECGMRKYMIEPKPGRLECADCGYRWAEA